jgi:hypothetical protein
MQVHSQLMLVRRAGQSQLILAENRLDCRSGCFRLQVVTAKGLARLSAPFNGANQPSTQIEQIVEFAHIGSAAFAKKQPLPEDGS